jgi:hypothetical protein
MSFAFRSYYGPGFEKIEYGPDRRIDGLVNWTMLDSTLRVCPTLSEIHAWVAKRWPGFSDPKPYWRNLRIGWIWRNNEWELKP